MSLSSQEIERYARQIVLRGVGGPGQNKLKAARALVVGAGGLGSPALQYLAGAGVGTLGIVDDDDVALSNLHRQIIHGTGDVGRPKTESAAAAIARINPHVAVEPIALRLDEANARAIVRRFDVVLDGSDNFATRYALSDACYYERRPLVSAALGEFDGTLTTLKPYEKWLRRQAKPDLSLPLPRPAGARDDPDLRRGRRPGGARRRSGFADGARGDPRNCRRLRRRRSRASSDGSS